MRGPQCCLISSNGDSAQVCIGPGNATHHVCMWLRVCLSVCLSVRVCLCACVCVYMRVCQHSPPRLPAVDAPQVGVADVRCML